MGSLFALLGQPIRKKASLSMGERLAGGSLAFVLLLAMFLGPLLALAGVVGFVAPALARNGEKRWVLAIWFLCGWLLFLLSPERADFFPALAVMAISAACSALPPAFLWGLVGFQLFLAVNFVNGWIPELSVPVAMGPLDLKVGLFSSRPASAEDWKIKDVLSEIRKRRDQSLPQATVALLSSADEFSQPSFSWQAELLGFGDVDFLAPGPRVADLAEFVILQTGTDAKAPARAAALGSFVNPLEREPWRLSGLPEARAQIARRGHWFERSYAIAARWTLPNKTEAILYERRRNARPPVPDPSVYLTYYGSTTVTLSNLRASFNGWSATEGAYQDARLSAQQIKWRGTTFATLDLEAQGVSFMPAGDDEGFVWDELRLLKLRRLKVNSLRVSVEDVKDILQKSVRGLTVESLTFDETISARFFFKRLSFFVKARLVPEKPYELTLYLDEVRLGNSPLPKWMIKSFATVPVSLKAGGLAPFAIELAGLSFRAGRLSVP